MMVVIDVEKLILESHTARAIWELIGKLELSAFVENKSAMFDLPGRPRHVAAVVDQLWLYGYCWGTNSAREIAGLCGYHPAFQWLTGMQKVNYKSLSDFRTQHSGALDKLFYLAPQMWGSSRHLSGESERWADGRLGAIFGGCLPGPNGYGNHHGILR